MKQIWRASRYNQRLNSLDYERMEIVGKNIIMKIRRESFQLIKNSHGDFNIHHTKWLKNSITELAGIQTINLSISHFLTQTVDFPTRFPNNLEDTASLIDLCFTSNRESCRTTQLCALGNSDHAVVPVNNSFCSTPSKEPPMNKTSL